MNRRNFEIGFLLLLAAGCLVVPLLSPELFPFSSYSMYSTRPTHINQFAIYDEAGDRLNTSDFLLRTEVAPWALEFAGMPNPTTENNNHGPFPLEEAVRIVRRRAAELKLDRPLRIEQTVCGRREDGSFGILLTRTAIVD